jgi:hypothetical protein
MRTLKLAACAAMALTAAAAGTQARGDVYGNPYTPTYSGYAVSTSPCSSGQCGTSLAVPSSSYAPSSYAPPSYSYSSYYPGTAVPAATSYPSGACPNCPNGSCNSCPNGSCGSCRNGSCRSCGPNGCCANGRCGTCPPGACQSGNCPANCPNGQCTLGRNRDFSGSQDGSFSPSYSRPDFSPPVPRYAPASWSDSPARRRSYDVSPSDRYNRDNELESPFYN